MIQINHFCLDRSTYQSRLQAGFYTASFPHLSVQDDPDRSYEHFMSLIHRVNPALQWHRQWKIRDREAVEAKLANPDLQIYSLTDDFRRVGFSVIKPETPSLRERFFAAAKGQSVVEIDYLAMFHGEEGQGRGRAFFQIFFDRLFKQHEIVYWSQHSTNAPTLADFYKNRVGMTLLGTDEVPDFRDL